MSELVLCRSLLPDFSGPLAEHGAIVHKIDVSSIMVRIGLPARDCSQTVWLWTWREVRTRIFDQTVERITPHNLDMSITQTPQDW